MNRTLLARLSGLFRPSRSPDHQTGPRTLPRQRLSFDTLPPLIYAIGDVHGCLDLLRDLEHRIAADCTESGQHALVILLGDYVDRGPESSGVIDHLLGPAPPGSSRLCLCGNHEDAMLAFLNAPAPNAEWLTYGGRETLNSYGFDGDDLKRETIGRRALRHKIDSLIPNEHIHFLRGLPILATFPNHVFVHAGIRPDVPMDKQTDRDLLWIRDEFLDDPGTSQTMIVHGHTITSAPFVSPSRVNVDTGAFASGRLSAAKILDGEVVDMLTT